MRVNSLEPTNLLLLLFLCFLTCTLKFEGRKTNFEASIMEFCDHTIRDGKIRVVTIINPCFHWVRCSDCPSLLDIHFLLGSCEPAPASDVSLGDKVVVKVHIDPENDQEAMWCRAVVLSYDLMSGMYHVIMADEMTVLNLTISCIYTIENAEWENFPPFHLIGLHGGVPNVTSVKSQFMMRAADILTSYDNTFEFSLVEIVNHSSGTLVFGDVRLTTPQKYRTLLGRLIREKLASYHEDYFQVLEEDGWLDVLSKDIQEIKVKLNQSLRQKKVLGVSPLPRTNVDHPAVASLRVIKYHTRLENLAFQTESHGEDNEHREVSTMECGDHSIRDGKISVVSVINPCFYGVRCRDCPSLLAIHYLLDSYEPAPVSRVYIGDKVVIKFGGLKMNRSVMWYRAVVFRYEELGDFYYVRLIDDTSVWAPSISCIYTIENSNWEKIPLPHVIGLHGGVPIAPLIKSDEDAKISTNQILKSHANTTVEFSLVESREHPLGTFVFGNVKLNTPRCSGNLLDILGSLVSQEEDYFAVLEEDGWLNSIVKEVRNLRLSLPMQMKEEPKEDFGASPLPPTDHVLSAALRTNYEDIVDGMRQYYAMNGTNSCVIPNLMLNRSTPSGTADPVEPRTPLESYDESDATSTDADGVDLSTIFEESSQCEDGDDGASTIFDESSPFEDSDDGFSTIFDESSQFEDNDDDDADDEMSCITPLHMIANSNYIGSIRNGAVSRISEISGTSHSGSPTSSLTQVESPTTAPREYGNGVCSQQVNNANFPRRANDLYVQETSSQSDETEACISPVTDQENESAWSDQTVVEIETSDMVCKGDVSEPDNRPASGLGSPRISGQQGLHDPALLPSAQNGKGRGSLILRAKENANIPRSTNCLSLQEDFSSHLDETGGQFEDAEPCKPPITDLENESAWSDQTIVKIEALDMVCKRDVSELDNRSVSGLGSPGISRQPCPHDPTLLPAAQIGKGRGSLFLRIKENVTIPGSANGLSLEENSSTRLNDTSGQFEDAEPCTPPITDLENESARNAQTILEIETSDMISKRDVSESGNQPVSELGSPGISGQQGLYEPTLIPSAQNGKGRGSLTLRVKENAPIPGSANGLSLQEDFLTRLDETSGQFDDAELCTPPITDQVNDSSCRDSDIRKTETLDVCEERVKEDSASQTNDNVLASGLGLPGISEQQVLLDPKLLPAAQIRKGRGSLVLRVKENATIPGSANVLNLQEDFSSLHNETSGQFDDAELCTPPITDQVNESSCRDPAILKTKTMDVVCERSLNKLYGRPASGLASHERSEKESLHDPTPLPAAHEVRSPGLKRSTSSGSTNSLSTDRRDTYDLFNDDVPCSSPRAVEDKEEKYISRDSTLNSDDWSNPRLTPPETFEQEILPDSTLLSAAQQVLSPGLKRSSSSGSPNRSSTDHQEIDVQFNCAAEESIQDNASFTSDKMTGFERGQLLPDPLEAELSDTEGVVASQSLKDLQGLIFGEGSSDIEVGGFLGHLTLHEDIRSLARRAGLANLTRPQALGMPAILGRRDVILVGPNKSRKTSAVLVPLMNLLIETDYYSLMPPGSGPTCVIVAPTSDRVKTIGKLCTQYGGQFVSNIIAYGVDLEKEKLYDLSAGCDILVTTPRCWLRLIELGAVTNLRRMCHLVLDRFDVLHELFSPEMQRIMGLVRSVLDVRGRKGGGWELLGVQTVLSCEKWTQTTEQIAEKVLRKPLLVFTSFVECAVLSKLKSVLIVTAVDAKIQSLVDLIKKHPSSKIAVACNLTENVIFAREAVLSTNRSCVIAHDQLAGVFLNQITSEWKAKNLPVLIFSDQVITEFNVTDADVLIHFSLPPSKSAFCDRFVTIRDGIIRGVLNPKDLRKAAMYIIAGNEESNSATALPFIGDYLTRLRYVVPPSIMAAIKNVTLREEMRKETPFCDNILQTGRCFNEGHCRWRHVLRETDQDGLSFTRGVVRLAVSHIHSAVKFSVRILEYKPHPRGEGPWIKYKTDFPVINQVMSAYFSSHGNRRAHGFAQIGDIVAYLEDCVMVFHRARVVDIVERNNQNEPKVVRIFALDYGYEVSASTSLLYELPEHMKGYPDQTEFLYLADLKPVDLDTSWSYAACNTVEGAIADMEAQMQPKDEIIGRLLFRFGSNAIVDNLRWVKRQKYTTTFALDLRHEILTSNSGLGNPEYSKTIAKLFQEANLDYYVLKVQIPKIQEKAEPSWAHLSTEPLEYTRVKIFEVESPDCFFVTTYDFQSQLSCLERDIAASVNGLQQPLSSPNVGDICITRSPEGTADDRMWNRCLIKDLHDETADVLYVDYGEVMNVSINQLFEIPSKFVTRLPFQTIECSLAGVVPSIKGDDWCEGAVNEFIGLVVDDGLFTDVYVKVVSSEKNAQLTGGRRYSVLVVNLEDRGFCVNEKLTFGVRTIDDFEVDIPELVKLFKASLSPHQDDGSEVDRTDDLNMPSVTPHVPPENGLAAPSTTANDLQVNLDEAEVSDLQSLAELLFPGFRRNKEPKELKMIEGSPSDVALQNDLSQPEEQGEEPKPTVEEVPEAESHPTDPDAETVDLSLPATEPAECPEIVQLFPYKTAKVCWSQDEVTITLRFMIPCLTSYELRCSTEYVTLIARDPTTNDLYCQKIFLFGLVNGTYPEIAGPSCLTVRLRKLVPGHYWPRLTLLETTDKRICYEAGDAEPDKNDVVHEYLESGAASQRQKTDSPNHVEEPDVDVSFSAHPTGTDDESDDGMKRMDYRPFRVGMRDDYDPLVDF